LTVDRVVVGLWLVFFAYWFVSARGAKQSIARRPQAGGIALRATSVVLFLLLARLLRIAHVSPRLGAWSGPAAETVEVAAVVLGLAFAVWARVHLGRNWGMPMSLQEGHEFVSTGPYAYVRHPIYAGLLFAMLGSALRGGVAWVVLFLVCGGYFTYSAKMEERDMLRQFPNRYPNYLKRTKMLIPFAF